MSSFRLQVGGNGYIGKAGTGGQVFNANTSGSASGRVFYRVPKDLLGTLWEGMAGKEVHEAFLNDSDLQSLSDDSNILFKTEAEVRGAGASNYVLWRMKS